MTLILDGTLGVSGVAGSATAPALIGSDADSGYYINSANEPNASVNGTAVWNANSTFGFKNRIINGAMVIDQRNAGSSISQQGYAVDRFVSMNQCDGSITSQQVSDAPDGFNYSYKITTTTADASLGTIQYMELRQLIEGYNVADLGWGSASAKTITLSFWTKSSLTGTFGGTIMNSSVNRSYPFSYTISAANTWEFKTITIPGDTTGTWEKTNGNGMFVIWNLGAGTDWQGTANAWVASRKQTVTGAVSVIGTLNATWQITGVQFEKGSTATSFDYRDYGRELIMCQRYFEKCAAQGTAPQQGLGPTGQVYGSGLGAYTTGLARTPRMKFAVTKRAAPTITFFRSSSAQGGTTDGVWSYFNLTSWASFTGNTVIDSSTLDSEFGVEADKSGGFTSGYTYLFGGTWTASSEL